MIAAVIDFSRLVMQLIPSEKKNWSLEKVVQSFFIKKASSSITIVSTLTADGMAIFIDTKKALIKKFIVFKI